MIFGFSRMNCSTGSYLHAMDPGLGTMEVPALGALSPDYVVGNLSPAELGEKRDLIWVFFFVCIFGFGFCMVTLSFPCSSLGLVLQCDELKCFCYHADASLCLGLSEFHQIML